MHRNSAFQAIPAIVQLGLHTVLARNVALMHHPRLLPWIKMASASTQGNNWQKIQIMTASPAGPRPQPPLANP